MRPLARKGKDYALFFAVNKYQSPKLTSLQNPISDAKRIAQELQNSYGFQTEVVENPTYETIEQKLQEYNRNFNTGKFDKDGQLLIFFSGHGSRQLTNGYFLPSDVNPDNLRQTAFAYKLWRDDMDAIDCKHILVAIDACYSGSFDPKFGMRTDGLFGTRAGELTEGQLLIAEHEKHKTRLFFTSGESEQPTPDKSDFAKKFMASLLSKGYDDGVLTSSEMFSNHLEKAAPRPRTGEFGGDEAGSSFVFVVENGGNTEGVSENKITNLNQQINTIEKLIFIEKGKMVIVEKNLKLAKHNYVAKQRLYSQNVISKNELEDSKKEEYALEQNINIIKGDIEKFNMQILKLQGDIIDLQPSKKIYPKTTKKNINKSTKIKQ